MATKVNFEEVSLYDGSLEFRFGNGEIFRVISLNNGVMLILPHCGCDIYSFFNNVAGCFEEGSNFNGLKAIEFEIYGARVSITKKDATPEKIFQLWNKKMEENRIKREKEHEEYMKTPEYRAKRAKKLKADYRLQSVEELVRHSIQNISLEFKNDEAHELWNDFVEVNSKKGGYDFAIRYAEYWAKFMQYLMDKHEGVTVDKIAAQAALYADNIEGNSGYFCFCSVFILSQVWKYGEELRKWYNRKYDHAGDEVIEPAVLTSDVG